MKVLEVVLYIDIKCFLECNYEIVGVIICDIYVVENVFVWINGVIIVVFV